MFEPLFEAASLVPAGRYAVGVSGGADSVALLHLLHHHRPDLHLHVVHLDHQTRGEASTGDARFVRDLAIRWNLPYTIARRDQIEPHLAQRPHNKSALYRALRHELYRQVAAEQSLAAVLLAHHADDQAETVLQHLLRGTGPTGMPRESRLRGLRILRPLLDVPGHLLRDYLTDAAQPWREDASNQSAQYFRNRLRQLLKTSPHLTPALLDLNEAHGDYRRWIRLASPELPEAFPVAMLQNLPSMLAIESARRWLLARGVPPEGLTGAAFAQLLAMANDAASPPRQHFPGHILIRRRRGMIFVDPVAGRTRDP